MYWITTPYADNKACVYFEQPEEFILEVENLPEGPGALYVENGQLIRKFSTAPITPEPSDTPETSESDVWDEMAAAYKEGVQEA